MNGEAIVELSQRLVRPIEIGGLIARPDDWTVVDPAGCISPGPSPLPLVVATLGAVRDYLTANKEDEYVVAQANAPLEKGGKFASETIACRFRGDFQ